MNKEERIKSLIIERDRSLLDAIKKMDEVDSKLLIVMGENQFFSLVSIGDIQRSLIQQPSFETEIQQVVRSKTEITIANNNQSFEEVKALMLHHRAEFMPIINEDGNLEDVFFWEEVFESENREKQTLKDIPVVIMAGGKGTRLQPITNIIPKALVPIGKKPIVEEIIDRFLKFGCQKFYLTVNYKHELIKQYFDTQRPELDINYVVEENFYGTAGSLSYLKDELNGSFFLHNCDILVDQDLTELYQFHETNRSQLTIVSALKHYKLPYGTLEMGEEGMLASIEEKPELTFMINAGLYILDAELINEIPEKKLFHITHLIEKLKLEKRNVSVFPVSEKSWMDIGVWGEYDKTLKYFEEQFSKSK